MSGGWRVLAALAFGAAAAGATWLESEGRLGGVAAVWQGWMGGGDAPAELIEVTAVEVGTTGGAGIEPLDAALLLRAVERHGPRAVVFLDPLQPGRDESLLRSKLRDVGIPVVFVGPDAVLELPDTLAVAGGGTSVFMGLGDGETVNPAADGLIQRVELGNLLVRVTRAEGGMISPELDGMFRDRVVAAWMVGGISDGGRGLAAALNRLGSASVPVWVCAVPVLLALTVPWWPGTRGDRLLAGVIAGGIWTLASLGAAAEDGIVLPVAGMLVVVVAVGVLPRRGARRMRKN